MGGGVRRATERGERRAATGLVRGRRDRLNPSWVLREEDGGEALLFDADTGEVWVANRTAVAVWKLVDGGPHGLTTCWRSCGAASRASTRRPARASLSLLGELIGGRSAHRSS